ncbi:MAG: flagellar basal body L-ring protein FlgH [Selenomonadaceae bacterium]|nr:flagellar basal body L-ring protein FlgH [Selenomonadaceae bacterium]
MTKKFFAAILIAVFVFGGGAVEAKSLWVDNGSMSMYADKKARNVGDILTIVINESTTQTATKARTNSKSGSLNVSAGTGIFDFIKAFSASGSDAFQADGSATDTNRFNGQITVTVIEVLPNDNMIVEGVQSIWQNRDEHKITLRGVIRRDDVTMYNTVPSNRVADASIRFDGKGPLNAKQRQGILTQLFNFLF